jgi:hypothetical protein
MNEFLSFQNEIEWNNSFYNEWNRLVRVFHLSNQVKKKGHSVSREIPYFVQEEKNLNKVMTNKSRD